MVAINCKTDLIVNLTGQNKCPLVVLGRVIKALSRGGRTDLAKEFRKEAWAVRNKDSFIAVVKSYVVVV